MQRSTLERRLTDVGDSIRQLRADLEVADEQLRHFEEEAEDARLRALVSETPLAEREHRESQKHVDGMRRHRDELGERMRALDTEQDALLDQMLEAGDA